MEASYTRCLLWGYRWAGINIRRYPLVSGLNTSLTQGTDLSHHPFLEIFCCCTSVLLLGCQFSRFSFLWKALCIHRSFLGLWTLQSECSCRHLMPNNLVLFHHIKFNNCRGIFKPIAPLVHSFSIWLSSNGSALLGRFPFPSAFICFLFEASFFLRFSSSQMSKDSSSFLSRKKSS